MFMPHHQTDIVGPSLDHFSAKLVQKRYSREVYICIKLNNHTSNLIIYSKFFKVFRDFRGINLSKKCMNNLMSIKVEHSSKTCITVYRLCQAWQNDWSSLLSKKTVRYPRVTNSESGHDRFLFTADCLGSIAQISPIIIPITFI